MTTTDDTSSGLQLLRKEVPAHLVGKLPRVTCRDCSQSRGECAKHRKSKCEVCGAFISPQHMHLDYVGHAETTSILLDADPHWSWEPFALDADGLPKFDENKGLWIKLTVCGVTRLGYGTAENFSGGKARGDLIKEVIGDAIRNAAMRFGVALDLWAKTDLHRGEHEEDAQAPQAATARRPAKTKREQRTEPPAHDEFAARPEDAASEALLVNVNIALKRRGFETDEQRYAEVTRLVGRPITTTKQLNAGEARHVMRSLAATKDNPDPNPRNGDQPVPPETAAALGTPNLETLLTHLPDRGGVYEQLLAHITDAPHPAHLDRLGKTAQEAVDAGHLTGTQFTELGRIAKARAEDLRSQPEPSWAARRMADMQARADQMAGAS